MQKVEAFCAAEIARLELEIQEDLRSAEVNQSDPLLIKLMDEQASEMKFEQNWGSPGDYANLICHCRKKESRVVFVKLIQMPPFIFCSTIQVSIRSLSYLRLPHRCQQLRHRLENGVAQKIH